MLSGRTHGATHTPRRRALPRQRRRGVLLSEGGLYLREPPSDAVDDLMGFDRSGPSHFLIAGDKERTVLMFRLIWIVSIHTRDFLHHYMPTNIVLDKLRTRRGLKWGVPAMLLAIPCLAAGNVMTVLIGRGAPGWFHLLVLLCIWNAFKFLIMGPGERGAVDAYLHC